jgi:hypothetical protein
MLLRSILVFLFGISAAVHAHAASVPDAPDAQSGGWVNPSALAAGQSRAEAEISWQQELTGLQEDNEPEVAADRDDETVEDLGTGNQSESELDEESIDLAEAAFMRTAAAVQPSAYEFQEPTYDLSGIKCLPNFKITGKNKCTGAVLTVEKYKNAQGHTILNFTRDQGQYVICLNVDTNVILLKFTQNCVPQTLYLTLKDQPTNYYKSLAGARKILNKLIHGDFRVRGNVNGPRKKLREVKRHIVHRIVKISSGTDFVIANFNRFGEPFPNTRGIVTRNCGTLWYVKRPHPCDRSIQRQYIFSTTANPPFIDVEDRKADGTTTRTRYSAQTNPHEYHFFLNDVHAIAHSLLRHQAVHAPQRARMRDFIEEVHRIKRRDRKYLC